MRLRAMLLVAVVSAGVGLPSLAAGVTVGTESKVPPDPRQQHARWVRFRPADGEVVALNPPRFSWPYTAELPWRESRRPADQKFTLQIAASRDFSTPAVEVRSTPCNFYNFLPALEGSGRWYWRVGYEGSGAQPAWSDVRSFTIAEDAVRWDRSGLADALDNLHGHPRILFNPANRNEVLSLRRRDARSEELARYVIAVADRTLKEKWYRDFPRDDKEILPYMQMGRALVFVAFADLLTGDAAYAGFKERFLTIASYPPGGYSSPEGGGSIDKWETHLTEYLGLFYDWFYDELTTAERQVVRNSLDWRIDHTLNSFAWRRDKGRSMRTGSIAVTCSSHAYQNIMAIMAGALAVCDELPVAREALEIGTHYLIGITNGFGEDEAWNEGPGYGNGKMKWLTDATWYLQTAVPQLDLGKNEVYGRYCDFFARATPLGARHSSFGNRGYGEQDWCSSRVTNFRRVAMLSGDSAAMQNWLDTRRQLGGGMPYSPWIDYVLPQYASEPEPAVETDFNRLFPLEGWVTVGSAPPSDMGRQKDAVSMTLACRPRGGYSHSFRSENAFDIHAYGETIAVGGGTTSNQSRFANHTMSHNTVLVNGLEQTAAGRGSAPACGRIIAYKEGDGFVYFAGDATAAYGPEVGLAAFVRHVVFVDEAYFVIFDDLALEDDRPPGTFQWLYHVTPEVPLQFDREAFRVKYEVGDVRVFLQHVAHAGDLVLDDRTGIEGMINPITGEKLEIMDKWLRPGVKKKVPPPLAAHHLWISHKTPRQRMEFLAVVVPCREDDAEPKISPAGERGVAVEFRGRRTTIAFEQDTQADIAIDARAISRVNEFTANGRRRP